MARSLPRRSFGALHPSGVPPPQDDTMWLPVSIPDRIALWRLRRRLRVLQDVYYRGETSSEPVIREYLSTLERARQVSRRLSGDQVRRRSIHLGAGGHRIAGWVNVDLAPAGVDVIADFTRPLPFRSSSIDLIHSEDLLEHLDHGPGEAFLIECFRVLRPNGVMRLLTPDLEALVKTIYLERQPDHLHWCKAQLSAGDPCEALNMHLRMNGEHRFVYDGDHLTAILQRLGFRVRRVRFNGSSEPALRYLDLRDFGLSLFIEAVKPSRT